MFSLFSGRKKYNPSSKYRATMVVTVDEDTMGMGYEGAYPWRVLSPESTFSFEMKSRNFNVPKDETPKDTIVVCGHNTFYANGYTPYEKKNMIVFVTDIDRVLEKMMIDPNEGTYVNGSDIFTYTMKTGNIITFIKNVSDIDLAIRFSTRVEIQKHSDVKIIIYGGKMIYDMFIDSDNLGVFVNRIIMFKVKSDKSNIKIVHSSPSFKKWCPRFDRFFYTMLDIKNRYRFKLVKKMQFDNQISMEIHDR